MITAEVVNGKDNQKYIKASFRYHEKIVKNIAQVKGAFYHKEKKCWGIPYKFKNDFEEKMSGFLIHWVGEGDSDPSNGGISEDTIPPSPIVPGYSVTYDDEGNIIDSKGFKNPPWGEFQVKGFNMLVSRRFLILADDAGLGKTFQVATAIEAKKKLGQLERGLVLAKATLLYNWRDEIHEHTNLKAVVLAGTKKQRHKLYSNLTFDNDWTFIIMSYETFREDVHNVQLLDNSKPLDFCVLDEAHKIKNPHSKIGTVIHNIPFKYRYVLTATPLPNSPLESFNYLKFGNVIDMNWWQFEHRYALKGGYNDKEVVGYQNITELRQKIQSNMLRRRKKDKLKDLPDVVFKEITLEMTKTQEQYYKAVKNEILEDLKDTTLDKIPSALTKLLRLQQITNSVELIGAEAGKKASSAKLIALDDLLEDLIDESGEKVIIFSRFRRMIDILQKRYRDYNPAVVHGDVDSNGIPRDTAIERLKKSKDWNKLSQKEKEKRIEEEMTSDRQKQVYKFQNDDSCKIFLGTAPACREGLTLTKATHVIFLDCEWSPAYVEQAFSRAHRIGQKNAVTVYFLICRDTIDEYVRELLKKKETMAQTMLDEGIENVDVAKAREVLASMIGENVDD